MTESKKRRDQGSTKERIRSGKKVANGSKTSVKKSRSVVAHNKDARAVKANLGDIQTLPQFLATAGQLTPEEREQIIDQALVMIEHFFVHLPLKRAMHAVEPIQRLRLLRHRHAKLSERAFHDQMISIYTGLRDLHTNYILPNPYNSRTAFVPFRIEELFETGTRQYIVTEVSPTVSDLNFKPGVTVTHWNNIPIDRAVEVNAEREAGSNLDARHAHGLEAMTNRWMGMSLPPDEESVTIRYVSAGQTREAQFDWQVFLPGRSPIGVDLISGTSPLARVVGIDAKAEVQRRVRKLLFAPDAVETESKMLACKNLAGASADAVKAATDAGVNLAETSTLPDVFSAFREVTTPDGKFGYIRVRTFNVDDDEAFIQEFIRLVGKLPQNGLILDVRGNGGGLIMAGERLLQVLTPTPIEPARLHFINTPLTLKLCKNVDFLSQWKDSIAQSIETGTSFSQGFSLLPAASYNDIGQKYQGPVVLVTDALCYSTTDIFAAGFQDHKIGKILGTSANTGAGGANVWTHDLLRQLFAFDPDSPFKPLPKGASFRVAVRQTTRVGERIGVPIEDLGVVPDELHQMTRNDILNGNVDLINKAGKMLSGMPFHRLEAVVDSAAGGALKVTINTQGVTRVDTFLNRRPRLPSLDVTDGESSFDLPGVTAGTGQLEMQGYRGDKVVAVTRVNV